MCLIAYDCVCMSFADFKVAFGLLWLTYAFPQLQVFVNDMSRV